MIKLKDILIEAIKKVSDAEDGAGSRQDWIGIYNGKFIQFKANFPVDAKKHTINYFKVPKSKYSEVVVISKKEYDIQQKLKVEGKINEGVDFRVKVEDRKGKLIQGGNFTLKSDANLYIKDMMKKHKLKREKGFWGNRKTGIEMSTNF
tara:strand:+ start:261 stop:704 length:444 start_codon:yes stop_codon:yes gene_type:complete